MSEWRPEGWENPYLAVSYDINNEDKAGGHPEAMHILFENSKVCEASADAMLTALRASAGRHHISPSDNDIPCKLPELWPGQTGYVVFIPDEKV